MRELSGTVHELPGTVHELPGTVRELPGTVHESDWSSIVFSAVKLNN